MHPNYDYLIIGQGLSGSLLAWCLIEAGQRVLVIDNQNPSAASRVAAGLINPVTGKRLVKESGVDAYLASARECYTQLEKAFDQKFMYDKSMLRLLDNDQIKQAWQKRSEDPEYHQYLGKYLSPDESAYPTGGFLQQQTGYLLTGNLLTSLRAYLMQHEAYIRSEFDYRQLTITEKIHWQEYQAKRIIFCEGARVINNPWFRQLPMQPAQGEILTLQTNEALPEWIINGGQWLLPLDHGLFKIGATYVWPTVNKPLDEKITQTGKQTLLKALEKLFPALKEYRLVEHAVGIRPNSRDKRPLLGFHAQYPHMAVFNGFGSKGSMLIPYYAKHFTDVLLNGAELYSDVDIKRSL